MISSASSTINRGFSALTSPKAKQTGQKASNSSASITAKTSKSKPAPPAKSKTPQSQSRTATTAKTTGPDAQTIAKLASRRNLQPAKALAPGGKTTSTQQQPKQIATA